MAEAGRHGRNHSEHIAPGRDGASLFNLRHLRDNIARPARCARRPQAGTAAHPVHDVSRPSFDLRRSDAQVRQDRRRRDRQLPSARRHRRLRRSGAAGAGLDDARPAGPGPGQLRLRGRRHARSPALHRGQADVGFRTAHVGAAPAHRADASQLRKQGGRAGRAAGPVSEPAGQRRLRYRGRPGDEHPAAQPRRSGASGGAADRPSRSDDRPADGEDEGAGLPTRRPDHHRPRHAPQDLRGGERRRQGSGRMEDGGGGEEAADRRHLHPLRRGQGQAGVRHRPPHQRTQAAATAQRHQRDEREGRHPHGPGDQAGRRPEPRHGLPLQAHGLAGELFGQSDVPGSRLRCRRHGAHAAGQPAESEGDAALFPRLPPGDGAAPFRVRAGAAAAAHPHPRRLPHHLQRPG